MKQLTLLVSTLLSAQLFAQNVGINATGAAPNASAALDVDMANKGILIPRVALTSTATYAPVTGAATTSLMVYNTATAGAGTTAVTPGYYYWDGTQWVRFIGGTNSYWRVGTSAADVNQNGATRFIGTTTNDHMDYVTNGIVRGRFSNLGEFFVGTTATALPGDLMNGVGNATFPWAVNGYTTQNAGGVYGLRQAGSIGTWGSVQGETDATIPANSSAVRGSAGINSHVGVLGIKPTGGAGFGGLFLNDLGFTGGFFNLSDERLKIQVKPMNNALEQLSELKVYSYYMDTVNYETVGDGTLHFGVMAQELKEVFPNLVKEKDFRPGMNRSMSDLNTPNFKVNVVNYLELVPVTIQAIQEQQELIKLQQVEIDELQRKLFELEKRLEVIGK